jgi:purine-binding chemotaxis protein CheW
MRVRRALFEGCERKRTPTARWVAFRLEGGRYALPLQVVERIVGAAQVTPLPLAPPVVLGAVDIEGRIVPVFNLRERFELAARPLEPADHFLIARTRSRVVALVIDGAEGVIERPASAVVDPDSLAPNLEHLQGVIPLEDGMVLIQDLERFLSAEEARALDAALASGRPNAR